ncbi:GntR family transcriptional regulator [Acrocarpospora pleiomorpha]|uniref:GntR family transcriptional regulator n=1 Tax=Acrocarpospora pleiomorpha TaxID=90975 RepID=A0A5M3Y1E4_9ACTN|nr:GntR family transcriptional regulator [Acrocarpospora pleiomorpha]GES27070.1 GntR family transcriptional regulator [Acrocarpospora pleiomorpha]
MTLPQVNTQTKAEAAYSMLRDAVRQGVLKPGQRVTLNELAAQLGMSLTPVREALRLMASQGLVEQESNRYTTITQYTLERGLEVYRLRLLLEPLAAEMAVRRVTEHDIAKLTGLLADGRNALPFGQFGVLAELNYQFHMTLYSISGQSLLIQFIDRLWNGVPFQTISLSGRTESSLREHEEILDAVKAGDADGAASLVRRHIGHAAHATLRQLPPSGEHVQVEAEVEALMAEFE